MSEDVTPPTPATAPPAEAAAGFGRRLADAREAQGLSVAEVAARLRLHPKQVAALEAERLESLPEPAFVRGFLRNYAKELKLDPAPLLEELARRQPVGDALSATLGAAGADLSRVGVERASRLTVIVGTVLLLVVLGIVGWLASARVAPGGGAAPKATERPPVESPSPVQPSPAAPTGTTGALPSPTPSVAPAGGSGSMPPAAPAATPESRTPAIAVAQPAPAPTSAPPAPAAAVTAGSPSLRLTVGERPSWVEVMQADGRVLLTGLQEAGTERRLGPVQPPLRLVIGNASTVSVEYRGRAVDLKPYVRANDLARLSLD